MEFNDLVIGGLENMLKTPQGRENLRNLIVNLVNSRSKGALSLSQDDFTTRVGSIRPKGSDHLTILYEMTDERMASLILFKKELLIMYSKKPVYSLNLNTDEFKRLRDIPYEWLEKYKN